VYFKSVIIYFLFVILSDYELPLVKVVPILIKHYKIKTLRGVHVYMHIFLTSALVGGDWSASVPGHFTPRERASPYPLYRRLGGHLSWSGRHGENKILHPVGDEF
jgi:hypothetical protein